MSVTKEDILKKMLMLYQNPSIELSSCHLEQAEIRYKQISEQLIVAIKKSSNK